MILTSALRKKTEALINVLLVRFDVNICVAFVTAASGQSRKWNC